MCPNSVPFRGLFKGSFKGSIGVLHGLGFKGPCTQIVSLLRVPFKVP